MGFPPLRSKLLPKRVCISLLLNPSGRGGLNLTTSILNTATSISLTAWIGKVKRESSDGRERLEIVKKKQNPDSPNSESSSPQPSLPSPPQVELRSAVSRTEQTPTPKSKTVVALTSLSVASCVATQPHQFLEHVIMRPVKHSESSRIFASLHSRPFRVILPD